MYHILVVDDDSSIRERISRLCVELCGERAQVHQAANGMRAVEQVCSQRIDMIFADIKMPVCDGLEMMEKLRALQYLGQVVVISGFDEFDFVRRAMKLGAVDYLLKPVEEKEFQALLENCLKRMDDNRAGVYQQDGGVLAQLFEQQSTVEKLVGEPSFPGTWRVQNGISPQARCAFYVLDVFAQGKREDAQKQVLYLDMQSMFSRCFEGKGCRILQGELGGMWAVVIVGPVEEVYAGMESMRARLREADRKYGASPCLRPLEEAAAAWNEAAAELDKFFYDLTPAGEECGELYPYDKMLSALADDVCQYRTESFSQRMRQLFACLCREQPPVEGVRQLLANLVYRVMSQNNAFISVISKYKFTGRDAVHAIQDVPSAQRMRDSVTEIFCLYIADVQEKLGAREDYAVHKAKNYIEKGYQNEISLSVISEKLGLHPNYFSTLFKNKTGTTYTQYLRSVRIGKAKELMKNTNLKLYAVAESVGYKDNAHFYRAFKEETGLSPAQYKKQQDD